ncbi:hypothetical protein CASFOL_021969 [Castilleja foliolosa]|uniref:Uncharacterized protein n=1 Tax=Castilleja foliolosa TaxID=1961234 RepID=A0ABD3D1U8_9LAMI
MPTTDFQEASSSSTFFSIRSRRRDQVHHHPMDPTHEPNAHHESEPESFQRRVADRFHNLSSATDDDLLSIPFLEKLLETFLSCQDDFNAIVSNNRVALNKPPMDRHVSDYFERSVKALDICNAIRDGIEQIRQLQRQLEIVLCALDNNNKKNQRSIGEGQFRRAKKALVDLAIGMLDEKESNTGLAHRNRSFGRNSNSNITIYNAQKSSGHFRSLSWSVSRSWSAAKQLQALSYNLVGPRANEITSTNGLSLVVFTMSYVLFFVMWALVAAIPCQDRGLHLSHFNVAAKQYLWAGPILSLHDRITEESKKRDRKNACGLLREMYEIEKCAKHLNDVADCVQFPMREEKEMEVRENVGELRIVYEAVKDGLCPLERRVRDVFHRIVRSRTDGLADNHHQ